MKLMSYCRTSSKHTIAGWPARCLPARSQAGVINPFRSVHAKPDTKSHQCRYSLVADSGYVSRISLFRGTAQDSARKLNPCLQTPLSYPQTVRAFEMILGRLSEPEQGRFHTVHKGLKA